MEKINTYHGIEEDLAKNMEFIESEIADTGAVSEETMARFFNKRERHLVLETMQAVNSTSYRHELWNPVKNKEKFDRLAEVMEKVAEAVKQEKVGEIMAQVKFLLDKVSPENDRFYDHCFKESVDAKRFQEIYKTLEERLTPQHNQVKKQMKESGVNEIEEEK